MDNSFTPPEPENPFCAKVIDPPDFDCPEGHILEVECERRCRNKFELRIDTLYRILCRQWDDADARWQTSMEWALDKLTDCLEHYAPENCHSEYRLDVNLALQDLQDMRDVLLKEEEKAIKEFSGEYLKCMSECCRKID